MTVEEMQKSSKNVTSIDKAIQTDPILSNQNSINGTTDKEDSENKNAINDIKKSEFTQTVEKSEKEVKPEEKKRDESEKQEKNDEKKSESKEEKKSEKDIKEKSKDEEQPIKKEKKRNLFSSINNKFKEKKKKGDEKTLKKTHSNTEVASKDKEETRKVEKERSKKSNPKEDVASKDKKETKKEEKEQSEKSDPKEDVASKDKKETKKEEKEQSEKSDPKEEVASKDKKETKKEEKEQSEKSEPKEEVASKDKKETKKEEKEQSEKSDPKEEVASKNKKETKKEEKEQLEKSDPKEEVATENKEKTKNEEEEKSKKTDAKEEVASKDKEEKVKNDKAILPNGKKEGTENVATAETRQKKPHALRATLTRAFSFSPSSNKNRNTINAIPINTKVEATLYSIVICNSERIGPELVSSLIISGVRLYLIYTSNSVESAVSDKIKQLSSKISDPESRVSQLTPYLNNMSDLGQIITKLRHFPGSVENLYVAMNFSQNSRNIYNADNFNQNFFLNHLAPRAIANSMNSRKLTFFYLSTAFKSSKESELLRLPEFSELATLPDTPSNDTKKIKTNAGPLVYMALLYSDIVRKHRENRYRTQSTTSVSDGTNALKEEQLIINSDCTVHELTGAKPAVWFMNANVVKPLSKALIEEKSREENKIYKGFWFNNTPKECETVDLDGKVGLPEKHRELYNKITRLALAKKIDLLKSLLEENEVKDSSVGTREAKTGIDKEEMGNKNSTTNHSKKEDKKVSESKNEKDEKISENKIDEKAPNEPTKDTKEGKDGVKQSDKDVTKKEHHVEISDKIEIAGAVPPTNVDENSKEKESQSNQNEDKSLQEKESKPLESTESKEVQVTTDKTEENAKEETLNSAEKNDENQPEKETEKKDVSEPKNEAEESDPKDNKDIDPPKEVTVTEKNVEEKEHQNEDKDKNEAKETRESEKEASNDKKPEVTEVKEEKTEEKAATTSKDDQSPEVNTETEKDKDTKNDQELNKSAELQNEGEKQEEKQNSDQNASNVDKDVQEGN